MVTAIQTRSRRPGGVSLKERFGQRCGWSAPRVGCADNHAKSASAFVLRGRSAGSPQGEARAGRTAQSLFKSYNHEDAKPQPPSWRGCIDVEPRPTAWDGARSALPA